MQYNFKLKSERRRFYKSTAWRGVNGVRNQAVKRDKECVWCREKGLVTVKNLEVDHIKELEECSYEEAIDMSNLRTLCRHHHNERHNRFQHRTTKNKYADDEFW